MARQNRAEVVVEAEIGVYHCIQRVVRRAFLCGVDPLSKQSFDHRKDWIRDRLEALAGLLGVEIAAFAVMSNHVHVILRNRPDVVALWSDHEVARRWLILFPGRVRLMPDPTTTPVDGGGLTSEAARASWNGTRALPQPHEPRNPLEQAIAMLTADPALMATIRGRLSSLSWFMRALAEPIARRANREDQCTGRFWEGRFKSQRLLDEAALLACSIYVDLNPIRAELADRPETSEQTSAHERIMALFQKIPARHEAAPAEAHPATAVPVAPEPAALEEVGVPVLVAESLATMTARESPAVIAPRQKTVVAEPERRDGWLSPIELDERAQTLTTATATRQPTAATKPAGSARSRRASDRGLLPMTLESYLELLDWTGRQLRAGASGVIPASLESILVRLQVSADSWLETVTRFGRRFHRAVGISDHLKNEAQRLGVSWLHGMRWSQAAFAPPLRS